LIGFSLHTDAEAKVWGKLMAAQLTSRGLVAPLRDLFPSRPSSAGKKVKHLARRQTCRDVLR